jgi:hypothetical protein
MPTNVVRVGPAASYGSPWEDVGDTINQGLQSVLGYYQEYTKQKRFEEQQKYERQQKAAEMAERAEQNKFIREQQMDTVNARRAQQAEQDALRLTPEAALQLPDYTETVTSELAGPPSLDEQGNEVSAGTEQKKRLLKTKKFGDYNAVLDYGGEGARKAALTEKIQTGQLYKNTPELIAELTKQSPAMASLYKDAEYLPGAVATQLLSIQKTEAKAPERVTDPTTGQIWGFNPQTGRFDVDMGKVGVKQTGDGVTGGTYKPVYDTVTKKDVMANDAMIAKNPERYGPPKKEKPDEPGKPLLAGEANRLTELRQGLQSIKSLRADVEGQGDTGLVSRFAAWVPMVTNLTGWGADAKKRQATIKLVKQIIGKGLEGGVLRKEDESKYADILPNMGDETSVAIAKVEKLQQRLLENEEVMLDVLERTGRDVTKLKGQGVGTGGGATPGAVNPNAPKDPLGMGL